MLLAVMALQTVELEQAKVEISGWYFLLVWPLKFLKRILLMVKCEGYWLQRVRLFCP
jgi:hypothetical protein